MKNFLFVIGLVASSFLANAQAPKDYLDFTGFKLQTLRASDRAYIEKKEPELKAGYTSPFFYADNTKKCVVFKCPSNGGTTSPNTKYSRIELRQTGNSTNWSINDKGLHKLDVTVEVNEVPESKPRVIIGQIHGKEKNSEMLKLMFIKSGSSYRIEARYQDNTVDKKEYREVFSKTLGLSEKFTYTITMKENRVSVTYGGQTLSQTYNKSTYGKSDAYYFKAGNYIQYNGTSPVEWSTVRLYDVQLSYNANPKNNPPSGSFIHPDFNSIDEGYEQLYVSVNTSDPDGDDIANTTLFIDGKKIRTEVNPPYEWGHDGPNSMETLGLTPGDHLFEVSITDSKGASTTISKTMTVTRKNEAPSIQITSPSHGDVFYLGDEIEMTANASDDRGVTKVNFKVNGAYFAQDRNGENGIFSQIFIPETPGNYTLGARAFDEEDAATEVTVDIVVEGKVITEVTDQRESNLTVFPNPTSGILHLSEEHPWELYSPQGIKVAEGKGMTLDVSQLPRGLYHLKARTQVIPILVN